MKESKHGKSIKKAAFFLGGLAFTAIGFATIPALLYKYQHKIYTVSLKKAKPDFDSMGPEIIKKSTETKSKEQHYGYQY